MPIKDSEKTSKTEKKIDEPKIRVLAIGLEKNDLAPLEDLFNYCEVQFVAADVSKLMAPLHPLPSLIICGRPAKNSTLDELGQLLRFVYRDLPIYLVCLNRDAFSHQYLLDMGYTEVYLSPIDWTSLKKSLNDHLAEASGGKIKSYQPIKLMDIKPGAVLEFDTFIYFPLNNRYVAYSKQGDPIDKERADQLSKHKISTLFVESSRIQTFYTHVSEWINTNQDHPEFVGVTEKKEKLRLVVRNFYTQFFNSAATPSEELGLELSQSIKTIVDENIIQANNTFWYLPFFSWAGETFETYSHASNVALYASLFAARLGIGNPEEVAIAALLMDCGLVNVPPETLNRPENKWTAQDRKNYQKHPEYALSFIKNRKLQLSPKTLEIIHQHHESFNGSGYPRGYAGARILPEAQLIALVELIDSRISIQTGKPRVTPYQALKSIYDEASANREKALISTELIQKVLSIFPIETKRGSSV